MYKYVHNKNVYSAGLFALYQLELKIDNNQLNNYAAMDYAAMDVTPGAKFNMTILY